MGGQYDRSVTRLRDRHWDMMRFDMFGYTQVNGVVIGILLLNNRRNITGYQKAL